MSALVPIYGRAGVVAHATVDDTDFDLVSQYRWVLDDKGYAFTAKYLGGGRAAPRFFRTRMHRLILGLEPDPRQGDHRFTRYFDSEQGAADWAVEKRREVMPYSEEAACQR